MRAYPKQAILIIKTEFEIETARTRTEAEHAISKA